MTPRDSCARWPSRFPRPQDPRRWLALLAAALLVAVPAQAEEEISDILGDLGTASVVDDGAEPGPASGEGRIEGQVVDAETGAPVQGVTVILLWPEPADGGEPRQEVRVSEFGGGYEFESVPEGTYRLQFIKAGYRASTMTGFAVAAGETTRADFPIPPRPNETADDVLELEAFVVEAATVEEIMASLELRMESDEVLNIMSSEDLSRYAAGDVAEALTRVAGINIVEGQFAIIRGLEDRYSSTLYNGAPVPSPDPDRQSVQLDLFPSEIVDGLVVQKTFSSNLPSNSAGGSIDIRTIAYPETFTAAVKVGSGFNENAWSKFYDYQKGSPVGKKVDGRDTLESEYGFSFGGRGDVFEHELRYAAVLHQEIDYVTAEGWQEGRQPDLAFTDPTDPPAFGGDIRSGDLSFGEAGLSAGHYDLTTSGREKQRTGYFAFGFDLDEASHHKVDASLFYTKKKEKTVQLKENGYIPNFDYGALVQDEIDSGDFDTRTDFLGFSTLGAFPGRGGGGSRSGRNQSPSSGALYFSNFSTSKSFENKRDLLVYQANGDHSFEAISWLDGFHVSWAANMAKTKQKEDVFGVEYFYEPDDPTGFVPTVFPVPIESLGPGRYAATDGILLSNNKIEENQDFGRLDADYEREIAEWFSFRFSTGIWYERAKRSVDSQFMESPSVSNIGCGTSPNCAGTSSSFVILGDTPDEMGRNVLDEIGVNEDGTLAGLRDTSNKSHREVSAWHGGLKTTFFDKLDVVGGMRVERIEIKSKNDPLIGERRFGAEELFPSRFLFFDRVDDPRQRRDPVTDEPFREICRFDPPPFTCMGPPEGTVFNDQIVGIDVPIDEETGYVDITDEQLPDLVNGQIDDRHLLPAVGFNYRAIEGMNLRGAWSKTVARPSFREMGYYVSVDPSEDDLVVGNPQLDVSKVESFDARAEYNWGDLGDLFAFSGFYKQIKNPIEAIVLRNPLNASEGNSALFRTFFNNPSKADLWGIEIEGRKHFDFLGVDPLRYFSIGANYTYIDAKVKRSEAERARASAFFGLLPDDATQLWLDGGTPFTSLKKSRRLFNQPEWIANVDLTFDHPDWGTTVTLAYFAISDVLDAAGSAATGPDGKVREFTLDRYVDSFYTLDLIMSQTVHFDIWPGEWTLPGALRFKVAIKNLTDSRRKIVYDPSQTKGKITERSYRVGRDYSFSMTYEIAF